MAVPETARDPPAQEQPAKRPRRDCPSEAQDVKAHGDEVPGPSGQPGPDPGPVPGPGQAQREPPPFAEGGYVAAGDGWWGHASGEWLYNVEEKTYFHLPSGELRLAVDEATVPLCVQAAGQGEAETGEAAAQPARFNGQVKWFSPFKGFGFLAPLLAGPDAQELFFHKNQVTAGVEYKSLLPGVCVTYSLGETEDGRICAVRVRPATSEHNHHEANEGKEEKEPAKAQHADAEARAEEAPPTPTGLPAEVEAEGEDGGEGAEDASSSASSVDIDLFEELHSGLYQVKGEAKDQCEDFAVEKIKVPISVLGETATCVFFGVFDGHGGAYCAEYAATHLAKNVLARLRDRTKSANDETALRTALLGGFKQTEHNFLQHARRRGDASGSTACTMTVFGPDEEMRLRLFLANAGDSRAVLGRRDGSFLRLTEDHKPNLPAEKKRIELEGGSVVQVAGIWRAILPQKRRTPDSIVGLAVSRSFGDKDFKAPNIVSADPDVTVHEVDWDEDEFVILATDGIWDVVSDKDASRLVQRCLRQFGSEEKAAEELVRKAQERGSKDDCTVLVVRFGWVKVAAGEGPAAAESASSSEGEGEAEDGTPRGDASGGPAAAREGGVTGGEKTAAAGDIIFARRPGPGVLVMGEAPTAAQEADSEEEEEEEEDREGGCCDGVEENQEEDSDEEDEEAAPAAGPQEVFAAVGVEMDDIFAPCGVDMDGQQEGEVLPQSSTPAAEISDLFAGLGPTREELEVVEGPALPPAQSGSGI